MIFSVGREELEAAISTLAFRQQAEIQRLLEEQEKQREQMKKMFEEQQKNLIREILQQVNISTQQSRYRYAFVWDISISRSSHQMVVENIVKIRKTFRANCCNFDDVSDFYCHWRTNDSFIILL